MLDLVGNPEDRFSGDKTHMEMGMNPGSGVTDIDTGTELSSFKMRKKMLPVHCSKLQPTL